MLLSAIAHGTGRCRISGNAIAIRRLYPAATYLERGPRLLLLSAICAAPRILAASSSVAPSRCPGFRLVPGEGGMRVSRVLRDAGLRRLALSPCVGRPAIAGLPAHGGAAAPGRWTAICAVMSTRTPGTSRASRSSRQLTNRTGPPAPDNSAYAGPRMSAIKRRTMAGSRSTWTWTRGRCAAIAIRRCGRLCRR